MDCCRQVEAPPRPIWYAAVGGFFQGCVTSILTWMIQKAIRKYRNWSEPELPVQELSKSDNLGDYEDILSSSHTSVIDPPVNESAEIEQLLFDGFAGILENRSPDVDIGYGSSDAEKRHKSELRERAATDSHGHGRVDQWVGCLSDVDVFDVDGPSETLSGMSCCEICEGSEHICWFNSSCSTRAYGDLTDWYNTAVHYLSYPPSVERARVDAWYRNVRTQPAEDFFELDSVPRRYPSFLPSAACPEDKWNTWFGNLLRQWKVRRARFLEENPFALLDFDFEE